MVSEAIARRNERPASHRPKNVDGPLTDAAPFRLPCPPSPPTFSPGHRPGEVLAKVGDWLSAGTRCVWVVDPTARVARVYRDDGSEQILTADQTLDGEDVVPGFSCGLGEIL